MTERTITEPEVEAALAMIERDPIGNPIADMLFDEARRRNPRTRYGSDWCSWRPVRKGKRTATYRFHCRICGESSVHKFHAMVVPAPARHESEDAEVRLVYMHLNRHVRETVRRRLRERG